ncbi:MAG: CBS domain-containing protein, partial [Cyanobacteria bacterium P01_F01_bin.53]
MFAPTNNLTQVELTSAIIRDPLIASPDTMVMDAIAQMSGVRTQCSTTNKREHQLNDINIEARSSCVVVIENNQLVGIFTERDVVRLVTQKRTLEKLPLCEVMTRQLITLRESEFTELFSAVNLIRQHNIRHLPLLDDQGHLVGLLTHESLRQSSRPIDLLRLRSVDGVMSTNVVCAKPKSTMLDVARLMTEHQVSSVVIVEEQLTQEQLTQKQPVEEQPAQEQLDNQQSTIAIPKGIVTERDVVQFQALGLALETCDANAVMSTPVFSVNLEDSLLVVQQLMEKRFIRRLVVTGSQGELLGIVTQSSILQALNPIELYKLAEVLEKRVVCLEAEKMKLLENRTIELERKVETRTTELKAKAEQVHLIASISSQIRSSLELQDILNTTVEKVQTLLKCDRVAIWQLQSDHQMLAVAEANSGTIPSQLGQKAYDPCFNPNWLESYRLGRARVVSDIYATEMADCHRAFLEKMQTRAKILLPIVYGDTLWGLLETVESHAPRQWQPEEVELLKQLATQVAIAIQQASAYQQAQAELIERRQTEIRLRESEQRFVTLAASAPVGIFRTDANGDCVYVNEHWCNIAGLTPEAAFGTGWMKGLHPSDQERIVEEWSRATQENRDFRLEYRFQRENGVVTWVFGQAVAEYDANGEVTGYIGTITDISDLKKANELGLLHKEHELAAIIVSSPLPFAPMSEKPVKTQYRIRNWR